MTDGSISQSGQDLAEDFKRLHFHAHDVLDRLVSFHQWLKNQSKAAPSGTRELMLKTLREPLERTKKLEIEVSRALKQCPDITHVEKLQELIADKKNAIAELRALFMISAGIRTASDWQSPSFDHTLEPQAGRHMGKIGNAEYDYTRDLHIDAAGYETRFIKEYVDTHFMEPMGALITVSGMAALSTVATYIRGKLNDQGTVLAGQNSYFQNKLALKQLFGERMRWMQEGSANDMMEIVRREKPQAIFLDTLCNSKTMPVPDLKAFLPALIEHATHPLFLVLDNSTRGMTYQPFLQLPMISKNIKLIVIESLNKFHEYGFDRVTGGIIIARVSLIGGLWGSRMHLGTILPDVSTLALPSPSRKFMEQRLARLGRNTRLLAEAIDASLHEHKNTPMAGVNFSGLPTSPMYAWMKNEPFCGAYFGLAGKPGFDTVFMYQSVIASIFSEAKKRRVDLIGSATFGTDATRVYLAARLAVGGAEPFIRVSVGTETMWELEQLKQVFIKVMENF